MPIVVLGAPRSGTSLVSHILIKLGVYMGDNFLPADDGNPNGYWEHDVPLGINKSVLEAAKGSWRDIPSKERITKSFRNFGDKVEAYITSQQEPWGWKDPRTVLIAEPWSFVLRRTELRWVSVWRDLDDTVASMHKLYGGTVGEWYSVAKEYRKRQREFVDDWVSRVVTVNFEDIVDREKAPTVITALARFCKLPTHRVEHAMDAICFRE